jgi:hypothetical protein
VVSSAGIVFTVGVVTHFASYGRWQAAVVGVYLCPAVFTWVTVLLAVAQGAELEQSNWDFFVTITWTVSILFCLPSFVRQTRYAFRRGNAEGEQQQKG